MREPKRIRFPRRDARPRAVTMIREGDRVGVIGALGVEDFRIIADPDSIIGFSIRAGNDR